MLKKTKFKDTPSEVNIDIPVQQQDKDESPNMTKTFMLLLQSLLRPRTHSFEVGKAYYFRTVTYHSVGKIERVTDTDIVLSDASWVASAGRYQDCLLTGKVEDAEEIPGGRHVVMIGSIVDYDEWTHKLPIPTTRA